MHPRTHLASGGLSYELPGVQTVLLARTTLKIGRLPPETPTVTRQGGFSLQRDCENTWQAEVTGLLPTPPCHGWRGDFSVWSAGPASREQLQSRTPPPTARAPSATKTNLNSDISKNIFKSFFVSEENLFRKYQNSLHVEHEGAD